MFQDSGSVENVFLKMKAEDCSLVCSMMTLTRAAGDSSEGRSGLSNEQKTGLERALTDEKMLPSFL
jgi:hypothetical protein